ncbi:RE2 [Symbiodinium microadriaticum]|nr:RE2 [Symbiodinium microadriaticum]
MSTNRSRITSDDTSMPEPDAPMPPDSPPSRPPPPNPPPGPPAVSSDEPVAPARAKPRVHPPPRQSSPRRLGGDVSPRRHHSTLDQFSLYKKVKSPQKNWCRMYYSDEEGDLVIDEKDWVLLTEEYDLLIEDDKARSVSPLKGTSNLSQKAQRKEATAKEKRELKKQFDEAKAAEYQSWLDNDVFELIDTRKLGNIRNYVTGRWVLTLKRDKDGKFLKCKARWVLRGFQDRQKDIQQTDSPAASRLAIQLAANKLWNLTHIDLKTAFLQGEAYDESRDIICQIPPEAGYPPYIAARVKKPAYGLNDAPRRWWNIVDKAKALLSYGLVPTRADREYDYEESVRKLNRATGLSRDLCFHILVKTNKDTVPYELHQEQRSHSGAIPCTKKIYELTSNLLMKKTSLRNVNVLRKKPLMIKNSSAPDDEEWDPPSGGYEEKEILDGHYEIVRNRLAGVNPITDIIECSNPDSASLGVIVCNWGNMDRAPVPAGNPKKKLKPEKGFNYHPLIDMCFNNSAHITLVLEADALDCEYAVDVMRRYQNRGMLIKTPTDEPPAPSIFMGVKGDPTTDIALVHHFYRHREVRTKQGGERKQVWACHGAVCRITFGFHSNIPEAKEWIHPHTGQRMNREEYQSITGIDPLKGKNPDQDGPQDITYLCPDPWMNISELNPVPVLAQWNGITSGDELSPAEFEAYAENFYQEAPSDLSEIWCTKGPFKVVTIALVHFNSLMTHKESRRLELVKAFLDEVLPFKPDIIAGDLNNLASRLKYTSGDVHPRNGLFSLYLEKMLAAYNCKADRLPSDPKERFSDLDCINAYVLDWGKTPHTATPSQKTEEGHPEVLIPGLKAIAGTTDRSLKDQQNRSILLQMQAYRDEEDEDEESSNRRRRRKSSRPPSAPSSKAVKTAATAAGLSQWFGHGRPGGANAESTETNLSTLSDSLPSEQDYSIFSILWNVFLMLMGLRWIWKQLTRPPIRCMEHSVPKSKAKAKSKAPFLEPEVEPQSRGIPEPIRVNAGETTDLRRLYGTLQEVINIIFRQPVYSSKRPRI